MSEPVYPNDSFMFRTLTAQEEEDFKQWAWNNNPPDNKSWSVYHPACRGVWTQRGLTPEDQP